MPQHVLFEEEPVLFPDKALGHLHRAVVVCLAPVCLQLFINKDLLEGEVGVPSRSVECRAVFKLGDVVHVHGHLHSRLDVHFALVHGLGFGFLPTHQGAEGGLVDLERVVAFGDHDEPGAHCVVEGVVVFALLLAQALHGHCLTDFFAQDLHVELHLGCFAVGADAVEVDAHFEVGFSRNGVPHPLRQERDELLLVGVRLQGQKAFVERSCRPHVRCRIVRRLAHPRDKIIWLDWAQPPRSKVDNAIDAGELVRFCV
mmetsp:Transcript_45957/g.110666  ORF Transcript_45957/g.110666 Transcript_45957/m.110666 type:complete len:257 (+) Transcript_45957:867-1637(+)